MHCRLTKFQNLRGGTHTFVLAKVCSEQLPSWEMVERFKKNLLFSPMWYPIRLCNSHFYMGPCAWPFMLLTSICPYYNFTFLLPSLVIRGPTFLYTSLFSRQLVLMAPENTSVLTSFLPNSAPEAFPMTTFPSSLGCSAWIGLISEPFPGEHSIPASSN